MTLDHSIEIMRKYGDECELEDALSVVERMVKNYTFLNVEQQMALTVFMEASREPV